MSDDDFDVDKIIFEYSEDLDDFGFTGITEVDFDQTIEEKVDEAVTEAVTETKQISLAFAEEKLLEVEKLILPFLIRLMNTKETYIKWPHDVREPVIKAQIAKILAVTRNIDEDEDE